MNNSRNDCWQKRCEKRCVRKTNRKKSTAFSRFKPKKNRIWIVSRKFLCTCVNDGLNVDAAVTVAIAISMCMGWIERVTVMMRLFVYLTGTSVWKFCAPPFFSRELTRKTCAYPCAFMANPCAVHRQFSFFPFFYSVKHFTETVQLQRHIKIARSFSHNKRNREKRWKYAIDTKDGAIVRWKKEKSQLVDAGRRKPIVRWWKEKSNNQQTCLTFKLNKWTNYFFFVQTKLQQIEINMPDALRAFIDLNQRASTVTRIHTNILLSHKINLTNPHSNHINYTIALSNEQKHLIEVY